MLLAHELAVSAPPPAVTMGAHAWSDTLGLSGCAQSLVRALGIDTSEEAALRALDAETVLPLVPAAYVAGMAPDARRATIEDLSRKTAFGARLKHTSRDDLD